jgi:hypothetical protein
MCSGQSSACGLHKAVAKPLPYDSTQQVAAVLNDRRWPVMKVRVHARTRHSTLSAALLVAASERHECVATQCSSSLRQTDLGG